MVFCAVESVDAIIRHPSPANNGDVFDGSVSTATLCEYVDVKLWVVLLMHMRSKNQECVHEALH